MRPVLALVCLALAACASSLGPVGMLAGDPDAVAVKLIAPGAVGRSCRVSVLGMPLGTGEPTLAEALGEILARDREANLVAHADVRWEHLVTGVYNRRCVEVRGDLARAITTVKLPPLPGHPAHH